MRGLATCAGLMTTVLAVCSGASAPETAPHLPAVPASYRIKLDPFVAPPTRTLGLLVRARINGGPLLRLLLDSGAQFVALDRKAALKSRCGEGSKIELIGAGAQSATMVKQLRAETLQVGDLTLRDIPVLITDRTLADGIQGVLPMSIFSEFLIRLDIPGKVLDLSPYPAEQSEATGAIRVVANNQLLFVKGTVNESHEGFFLLDTGASYTAISRDLARELNISEMMAASIPLHGGTTDLDAPVLTGAVRLRFESLEPVTGPVVAVDLSTTSRYHQLEISGLIGYPALCRSVLTINYRDSFIRLSSK